MNIYQIYMLIFILSYFGITLGLRSIILYRKTKIDARKVFYKETATKRSGKIIQIALFLMIVIAINFIWISSNYKYFLPIDFLEQGVLQTVGFILSMLGLIMGFVSQLQMKNSWRLGIDRDESTELVIDGLFSISRNPIYLSLVLSLIGFFLIAPNIGSIIFFFLMTYGINEKINDEEEFLMEQFGSDFIKYKTKVRRWI